MMYLVTYTVHNSQRGVKLTNELASSPGWAHHLDNAWLISTSEDVDRLYNRLVQHLAKQDFIFIVNIPPNLREGREIQGWMPQKAWDWLREHRNV